jgi:DNA-binding PadR family transcriptional regulator
MGEAKDRAAGRAMSNAELAILTLVAEQPRHGYEIEQVIEARGMRDWTEVGFSSIYYLLKKLEDEGLAEGHLEQAGRGPARKVYHITPAGRQTLHEALRHALAVPEPRPSRLLLAVGNLPALPPADAVAALGAYCDRLADRLAHVSRRREEQQPLPYFVNAMFDYSVAMIQAEITWIERFAAQIHAQEGGTK